MKLSNSSRIRAQDMQSERRKTVWTGQQLCWSTHSKVEPNSGRPDVVTRNGVSVVFVIGIPAWWDLLRVVTRILMI